MNLIIFDNVFWNWRFFLSYRNNENPNEESMNPNSQTNFSQLECFTFLFGHIIVDNTNVPILQNSFNGYQIPGKENFGN